MLQYLLNATAIWLISLVLFDVFLQRESYHHYNRLYLLSTFLLGLLLPLWQWQGSYRLYSAGLQEPLQQVVAGKQNTVTVTTQAITFDWQEWLWAVYIAGAILALCILIFDAIKIVKFSHSGKKSSINGWTLIETGKEHAPFSFMSMLFVNSKNQYSADEWNMILVHEKRHTTLLHFTDLLLMQLCHVIFWFHPFIYLYNKRLLLVHEYQADSAYARESHTYGKFLLEQTLLLSSPSLSHSFNHSPIKKRILMLTRKSSAFAKIKMLLFLPLVLVCFICFTKNSFSQAFTRNGNIVTYKGNKFEIGKTVVDTQILIDPISGKEMTKYIKHGDFPIKMNGQPIPQDVDKEPYFNSNDKNLRAYLVKNLKNELSELNDGAYLLSVSDVIIDDQGRSFTLIIRMYADISPTMRSRGENTTMYPMTTKSVKSYSKLFSKKYAD